MIRAGVAFVGAKGAIASHINPRRNAKFSATSYVML